jgi:hypothetical protein
MEREPLNVLVVYATLSHPLRSTIDDHLHAFERAGHRCFYLNLMVRRVPRWLLRVEFDLIVFHTTFLSQRWVPRHFDKVRRRAAPLASVDARRVALPQDEFLRSDLLTEFFLEAGVDLVCSVAPPVAWPVIYPGLDRSRVVLRQVLTGYLDPQTVARVDRIVAESSPVRPIDIGYRAWAAQPWLGRQGQLKTAIARTVSAEASRQGLHVDVSTEERDQLVGDSWFAFLASCNATVGVEGGASICDRDGSVKAGTETYLAAHPLASFEEVEAACFPGRDGELALSVISPRHLEACATRTCQILVEGDYNGILRPNEHYLPLRRDLSNTEAIVRAAADPATRERIVERAYRDVVASQAYTYETFVDEVMSSALGSAYESGPRSPDIERLHRRADRFHRRSRGHVAVKGAALRTAIRVLGPALRRARRLWQSRTVTQRGGAMSEATSRVRRGGAHRC